MNHSIRVAVCDDHRIVAEGLADLLHGAIGVECVGTAANGEEALFLLEHVKADVLLTDLDMPGMDGFELATKVKVQHPSLRVLVLTMHEEAALVQRTMDIGADGYLLKNVGRDELMLAIRQVHAGQRHFGSGVMESILKRPAVGALRPAAIAALSDREVEVLAALAEGLGNKEIGERLFISPRTVDTHRTNIMKKLDTHTVAGLVRIAIKAGLVK
jgi:two-component system response regulator NreC